MFSIYLNITTYTIRIFSASQKRNVLEYYLRYYKFSQFELMQNLHKVCKIFFVVKQGMEVFPFFLERKFLLEISFFSFNESKQVPKGKKKPANKIKIIKKKIILNHH